MKITDTLLGEHGAFYAQFAFMQDSVDTAPLSLIQAQGAMLAAALIPHAQIENDILFPALEAEIGPDGVTRVMRVEHAEIEALLKQIEDVRELTQAHDEIERKLARLLVVTDLEQARTLVRDLLYAAREHFAKEESVLFPMAGHLLTERALDELGEQWAQRRGIVLNMG